MEHEVFVPVPVDRLRAVLDDPARVARAVPGLQHDAGAEPVAGRLKVRIGSHSITYGGAVRVTGQDDGSYVVEGEAAETRGTGSVKLTLRLALREAEGGTTLTTEGTARADGRVTGLAPDAVAAAVTRLLTRFVENLGTAARQDAPAEGPPAPGAPTDAHTDAPSDGASTSSDAPQESVDAPPQTVQEAATEDFQPGATGDFEATPGAGDAPPPDPARRVGADDASPSAPDPVADGRNAAAEEAAAAMEAAEAAAAMEAAEAGEAADAGEAGEDGDAVAEAAHARRTMIGRSAEEVDHAPPRGRYAPVPAPQTVSTPAPLRWAAPAAALAVASAVVAVRVLRRRR
ncbi:SRPBCC domain-containing protein [Streptomyces sp. NPDC029526]|uniref:SRPBCC family protein n=1 Tax=Streptomyces sp. NPDC029526 TaxID=3155728 RepID=UPI0033E2ADEB